MLLALAFACEPRTTPAAAPTPPRALPGPAAAIAHGGVGTPPDRSDGPRRAVDAALAALEAGRDPLDAVVAGIVVLEDDPRFNAGTGSVVRLDGRTVQMDASLMASDGRFGAVLAIEDVRNPIEVARAVVDTPHLMLAGDGATRFARTLGLPPYDPATDDRRKRAAAILDELERGDASLPPEWRSFDWRAHWNFEHPIPHPAAGPPVEGSDTVGIVVRTADGRYAAGLSTGGTSITLDGRVGDAGILGAGLFAGPNGAVAATGVGERILEAGLARRTHEELGAGTQRAVDAGVALVREKGAIGLVAIGPDGFAAASSEPMAWAARTSGGDWFGP
jgi:isoaspartyl peptidase/L-asparaginase-like protein (Ntn-hydrolase superfamily)